VAAQKFLSPRTVAYHLYKAFPKLGIVSRADLGRFDLDALRRLLGSALPGQVQPRGQHSGHPDSSSASRRHGSRAGSVTVKVAPCPGPGEEAVMSPPWARAILRAMVSPTPDPAELRGWPLAR
jgi:hypothetical protein